MWRNFTKFYKVFAELEVKMEGFHGLLACAGVLGGLFALLTVNVFSQRFKAGVVLGTGGPEHKALLVAARTHANFAEYVPLTLLLLAGDLYGGAPSGLVVKAGWVLVAARVAHAIGMRLPAPNKSRAAGALLTLAVLVGASLEAVYLAI